MICGGNLSGLVGDFEFFGDFEGKALSYCVNFSVVSLGGIFLDRILSFGFWGLFGLTLMMCFYLLGDILVAFPDNL